MESVKESEQKSAPSSNGNLYMSGLVSEEVVGNKNSSHLISELPSGYVNSLLLKIAIYRWFSHQKWWFSMAMLNNQRVYWVVS